MTNPPSRARRPDFIHAANFSSLSLLPRAREKTSRTTMFSDGEASSSRTRPASDSPSQSSSDEQTQSPASKRHKSELTPVSELGSLSDLTDHETLFAMPLTLVIFGATGDLAKKKLFPALYKLCLEGHLPRDLNIVGYGRNPVDLPAFIQKQCVNVGDDAEWPRTELFKRISFHAGGYDAPASYSVLDDELAVYENSHPSGKPGNRLFFLSVPPTVFGTVAEMISNACRAPTGGFTRLMIEKPFGRDSVTFEELNMLTAKHFHETQLFRIDHYLGKEVILNLPALRWANAMFEPMWSNRNIESVLITFKENIGTEGRGGYFDGFGIIRDILQNHLLQAFLFLAMEPPEDMSGPSIVASKVELLNAVKTLDLHDGSTFLGQYTACGGQKGYLDDETVPADSKCPTFAATVLTVDNDRWRGVPFLLSAGKGLDERLCEFRIRFKPQAYNKRLMGADASNELVMRVQPDEALYMIASAKTPGINAGLGNRDTCTPVAMGLRYATQFGDGSPFVPGDAYERMLLNACRGDQALSVSAAELTEAWRIFTPLLQAIDAEKPQPVLHPFGFTPEGYVEWALRHGVDVLNLPCSWGGREAAEKLAEDIAKHAAEKQAAQVRAEMNATVEDLAFGY